MSNTADAIVPPTVDLLTAQRNRDDAFNSDVESWALDTPPIVPTEQAMAMEMGVPFPSEKWWESSQIIMGISQL
jgi:hypothetical protein